MKLNEVMAELKRLGTAQTRKTYQRHGADDNLFGVKVGDLKTVAKKIKDDQKLALELYDTENLDAMYLAGLVADGRQMTKAQLNAWAKAARCAGTAEYTVPWVAAESPFARELALKWMDSSKELLASCGWNTYSGHISITPDADLDVKEIDGLLGRVVKEIKTAPNRVRYCMNNFIIAVGAAVKPLLAKAKAAAETIGKVEVEMGDTACKVPPALDTIRKIESMGRVGTKRKTMKC